MIAARKQANGIVKKHPFDGRMLRGLAVAHYTAGDTDLLKCSWWYDWSLNHSGLASYFAPSTGYVPMSKFAGTPVQTTGYLLYLNEPEEASQSNMTAADAYTNLLALMALRPNMKFICGGVGVSTAGNTWMSDFHTLIMAGNVPALYPQFAGYHCHGYYAPGHTLNDIATQWATIKGYAVEAGGEFWITEFGANLSHYFEQMLDLVKQVTPERYSAYTNRVYTGNELPNVWKPETLSLIDHSTNTLTVRGRQYIRDLRMTTEATELINNGNFREDSSWTKGTGWTIASGKATHAAGTGSNLYQSCGISAGRIYRVAFTVSGYAAGTLTPSVGIATGNGTAVSADGAVSQDIRSGGISDAVFFIASSDFVGSIDNLTVYLVGYYSADGLQNGGFDTDTIWLKGTGWAISGGKATKTPGSSQNIMQSCGLVGGTTYRLTFVTSGRTAGTLTPSLGSFLSANGTGVTNNAAQSQDIVCATDTDAVYFIAGPLFDGSIDDVTITAL